MEVAEMGNREGQVLSHFLKGRWKSLKQSDVVHAGYPVTLGQLADVLPGFLRFIHSAKEGQEVAVPLPIPTGEVERDKPVPWVANDGELEVVSMTLYDRRAGCVVTVEGGSVGAQGRRHGPTSSSGDVDEYPWLLGSH
jgi:hypothetical protein